MTWEPVTIEEIDMNAEIGAYQGDPGDDREPIAREEPADAPCA